MAKLGHVRMKYIFKEKVEFVLRGYLPYDDPWLAV